MPDNRVDRVAVHMYKMGTGDCFVLKFMKDDDVSFQMLIDCGVWSGKSAHLSKFIEAMKADVGDHVDALVVTHEHKDHVYGFDVGEELFTDGSFQADRVWMGWTEDEDKEVVKRWKEQYGQKKRALAIASQHLEDVMRRPDFKRQFAGSRYEKNMLGLRAQFSAVLGEFAELHLDPGSPMGASGGADGRPYIGGMKGLQIVKEKIGTAESKSFFSPGDVIEDIDGLEGVKIYVLGPPKLVDEVRKEHGGEGESFEHNKDIDEDELLLRALNAVAGDEDAFALSPFDDSYVEADSYDDPEPWRRIDYDWLFSSGQFALRMNGLTNNLSLALAIEFQDTGRVMLFPGDAEFGSWKSWHEIDWGKRGQKAFGSDKDLTTEDLLRRTVFYKVAHHLSHNGTARSVGLDLMTHPDLVAMATLDYAVISKGWKSTMPNRLILKQLLEQTKGRTIIMNEADLYYDLHNTLPLTRVIQEHRDRMNADERREFDRALDTEPEHYIEYTVKV